MKANPWRRRLGGALCLAVALVAIVSGRHRVEAGRDDATAELMRMKLVAAQEVLRAIALQDFVAMRTNAAKLTRYSHASGWAARQSPEYELFTMEFRRASEELVRAAETKNIDAATVAYTQMTFSCVSCHKYMRGGKPSGG
ncbi:MAG: hypothetical protein DVB31_10680 [Verrucomicrobia bacterium]|nr:MAG: hypothetical protein DVB31_10680 [Verrucomicrobiota bacterium]